MSSSRGRFRTAAIGFGIVAIFSSFALVTAGCSGYTRDELDRAVYDRGLGEVHRQVSDHETTSAGSGVNDMKRAVAGWQSA